MCNKLALTASISLIALTMGVSQSVAANSIVKLQTPIVYGAHKGRVVTFDYGDTGRVEETQALTSQDEPSVEQIDEQAPIVEPAAAQKSKKVDGPATVIDDTVLVEEIKAITVVGSPGAVQSSVTGEMGVVSASEDVVLPSVAASVLNGYIGQPISLAALDRLSMEVVRAYRASGLPVVNVVIPEQDITNGNLQVMVVTAKLADVSVQGVEDENKDYYLENFTSEQGEVIEAGVVLADLAYMSRNPFRSVNAVYTPGDSFGTTNIILRPVESERKYTIYTGVENTGSENTGEIMTVVGAVYGDLWGMDHVIGYQASVAPENLKGAQTHVMTYTAPLPHRQEIMMLAAFSKSESDISQDVRQEGNGYNLALQYYKQLHGWRNWSHNIQAGLEWKRTESNTVFVGADATDTKGDVFNVTGTYAGETLNRLGRLRASIGAVWGPGGIGSHNDAESWNAIRGGADGSYVYGTASVEQEIDLDNDWRILLSAEGQLTGDTLPSTETFNLGGIGSVRGWHQSRFRTDSGFWTNASIFTPSIRAFSRGSESFVDSIRFYAFMDYGAGKVNTVADTSQSETFAIGSLGAGFNYRAAKNFFMDVSYGHQVIENGRKDEDNGRLHFKARLQY